MQREPCRDEIVGGGVIQADSSADAPWNVLGGREREAAIEVLLRLCKLSSSRNEGEPFGIGSELLSQCVVDRPRLGKPGVGAEFFVDSLIELRASAGREELVDVSTVKPVDAHESRVVLEAAATGGKSSLGK